MGNTKTLIEYPTEECVRSVLTKLGVDTAHRIRGNDQDLEYTACRMEELAEYFKLYTVVETTVGEKRVLGCFFLECFNEYIQLNETPHPLQANAIELLISDIELHKSELDYWSDTSDENKENWWPITKSLIKMYAA